ncbi:hypothetical protein [Deinococcus sedimenti]|uniref:Uncharacterized protein n=1 Tax=Deinococcus sedimenti TaxID=1867090 RepID=A0ABQ2S0V0_9DEIO|nr:hypothetical protein [Deinococcus sedimenti]GGR82328.1 hypothetical protein GCM10008960_06630 [Deinococcus sedimenti]
MISDTAIRGRLGEQASTDREVALMRDLLQASGRTPDDLNDEEWMQMVGQMEARKLQDDPNMK